MEIGTILKKVGTEETVEIIKVDDKTKTAIVKSGDGSTRSYSISTLKDKRRFTELDETEIVMNQKKELGIECPPINPEEVTIEEITCTVPEMVPMPGAEKLADLKKEYSKEEKSRKPRITITYKGETKTLNEWAKKFNMDPKKIRLSLRRGKTPEEIFG